MEHESRPIAVGRKARARPQLGGKSSAKLQQRQNQCQIISKAKPVAHNRGKKNNMKLYGRGELQNMLK